MRKRRFLYFGLLLSIGFYTLIIFKSAPYKKTQLEASRVVICGCARDVGEYLPRVFTNCMDPLKSLFKDYRIVIFENDSIDDTLSCLENFQKKDSKIVLLTEENLKRKIKKRTRRLAYARNECLRYAHNHFKDYDYLIVVDLDDRPIAEKKISLSTLQYVFHKRGEWDVVSIGRPRYYDIWALRYRTYPYNCWNRENAREYCRCVKKDIQEKLSSMNKFDFMEVESSFNGFAVYYFPKTRQCYYDGKNMEMINRTSDDCEHVAFHRDMRIKHNARVVISPLSLFDEE